MDAQWLLAVPNVSEGRARERIDALARAFAGTVAGHVRAHPEGAEHTGRDREVRLLDVHADADHDRSVFTLAGPACALAERVMAGARVAVGEIDVMRDARERGERAGQHPHVGALDVAPIVYPEAHLRGAACAVALALADRIGEELKVPVFLYGELTASAGDPGRSRAQLRRGGVAALGRRMQAGEDRLTPDFGPHRLHERAGATLVAARPPLVAFNVQLAPPATLEDARAVAAAIREGAEHGLRGVRAIAVLLRGEHPQVSMNVERPFDVPLAEVLEAIRRLAPVARAELVGLAPRAALEGFPADVPLPGFDPARHLLENALGSR